MNSVSIMQRLVALLPSKAILLIALTLGITGSLPAAAHAARYTVYIYNTRTNYGWIRSGFSHDVYTTYSACRRSITNRVNENRRYRTDFEAYAIVYHNSRPPSGRLGRYVSGWIIYIPGRGYLASAGSHDSAATAVCAISAPNSHHRPVRDEEANVLCLPGTTTQA